MIWIARIAAVLVGLFSLAMGAMMILSPAETGGGLGLGALSPIGLNALRADIGAFFLASALASGLALFGRGPHWLFGAAALYGLAFLGRLVGIAVDGAPEGIATPLVVEFMMVVLAVFAARTLSRS